MSKNITLVVDEEVLKQARIVAAERHMSLSAMVREYLNSLLEKDRFEDDARTALLKLIDESDADMGDSTWSREAAYER